MIFVPYIFTKDVDARLVPFYTAREVASYVRVNPVTLARWSTPVTRLNQALVNRPGDPSSRSPFSFFSLVEAYVMASLRREYDMKMLDIRRAVSWLKKKYPHQQYPLACISLETDGLEVFLRENDLIISASREGQIAIKSVISPYMRRIERGTDGLPKAFNPYTADVNGPALITIDPTIQFGRPVIRSTRIKTDIIASRFGAGESMADLSKDYDVTPAAIEEALRCEALRKSA